MITVYHIEIIVCIILLYHILIIQVRLQFMLGVLLLFTYPIVIQFYTMDVIVTYMIFFNIFCLFTLFWKETKHRLHRVILVFISSCSFVGIIVFRFYPQSIHGIHAAFLASVLLHIFVLYMDKGYNIQIIKSGI